MKTVKLKIADKLYQMETGPAAQVGDQVKMFLDTEANPALPEFVFGVIQHPIKRVGCDEYTLYTIVYDLPTYFLTDDLILSVVTTSAADVVANDLLIESNRSIAAEGVLQDHIDAEGQLRITADGILQGNINTETNARIAADNLKQDKLKDIGGIDTGTTTGASLGNSPTQKAGFHGASVVQRSGAAQVAVPVTTLTVSNPPTQAEVQAVINRLALTNTLVNELREAGVQKGIIKGSA